MGWRRLLGGSRRHRRRDYADVLLALAGGDLREGPDRALRLPDQLRSADAGGTVHVARRDSEIAAVLFRRRLGKGGNFRGHLYLPEAHEAAIVTRDYDGRPMVDFGAVQAVLGRRLEPDWHEAWFDLD